MPTKPKQTKVTVFDRNCTECGELIPPTMRLGAAYCSNACRQKAYRRRTKDNSMYMKIDENTSIFAVNNDRLVTDNCSHCNHPTLIYIGKYSSRFEYICQLCFTKRKCRQPLNGHTTINIT